MYANQINMFFSFYHYYYLIFLKHKVNSDVNLHMEVHDDSKVFKCHDCNKSFLRRQELQSHSRTVAHYRNFVRSAKPFACDFCTKKFAKKRRLKKHLATHKGHKKSSKSSKRRSSKFSQKKSVKKNNKKDVWVTTYFCRKCNFKSHTKRELIRHEKTHSEK